jgi:hypothetical protein
MGWVVNATPLLLYPRERDPVPILQGAGWASGPIWTGAENLAPLGFDPRILQLVASRYADYAIPVPKIPMFQLNKSLAESQSRSVGLRVETYLLLLFVIEA